jgi:hypothetical protein
MSDLLSPARLLGLGIIVSDEGARSLFRDDAISWLLVMKYADVTIFG